MEQRTIDHTRVRVCLDVLDDEKLSGRLYNMTLAEPIPFHDLGKMIIEVDTLFDEIGSPQSFQKRRTFRSAPIKHTYQFHPDEAMEPADFYAHTGVFLTFDLVVESRQYTGLQGRIYRLDGSMAASFMNEMELLKQILYLIENL